MDSIISAISTVGFPIVMSLLMVYFYTNSIKTNNETITKVIESINNNTNAINILSERLDVHEQIDDLKK